MSVRHRRRPLLVSVVLVVGAGLALTACGPDNTDSAGGSTAPTTAAPAPASATTPSTPGAPAPAAPTASKPATAGAPHTATHAPSGASPSGGTRPDGGGAGSDARPCDIQNLEINATVRAGAANQWVIDVHNTGTTACSLSSSPGVDLGNSVSPDQSKNIKPILASGTLRFPVPAGQHAYAVIDLDPSGATTGTAPGIDELNVLVDDDDTNMPLANTRNFPLNSGARVLNPQMGIYRPSVAEAVTSMKAAGK
ncbi:MULTISPECIES: DUF4232 domain-containing protein [unclassified Kitasatospora]|uniref:DUF4232 domain-containing protein n=1 Tax=unclassified Kitasatospora TaxID=2633591 RepID=UPI0033F8BC22